MIDQGKLQLMCATDSNYADALCAMYDAIDADAKRAIAMYGHAFVAGWRAVRRAVWADTLAQFPLETMAEFEQRYPLN
jgi:hypothetical protein